MQFFTIYRQFIHCFPPKDTVFYCNMQYTSHSYLCIYGDMEVKTVVRIILIDSFQNSTFRQYGPITSQFIGL